MTFAYKAAAGALALAMALPVGAQPVFKVLINPGDQGEQSRFAVFAQHKQALEQVLARAKVPGVAVSLSTDASADLAAALGEALHAAGAPKPTAVSAADFDYVATLGYFTPRTLPGAQVAVAATVARLVQAGGVYVDTRTDAEFKAGHPAGAVWVPYVEKSAKDPDFKASDDQFDLSKLPADKQAPLVLACNGAECWKSYKASLAAIKAGHTQVHWFRGGFPEWRAAGLKVASGG